MGQDRGDPVDEVEGGIQRQRIPAGEQQSGAELDFYPQFIGVHPQVTDADQVAGHQPVGHGHSAIGTGAQRHGAGPGFALGGINHIDIGAPGAELHGVRGDGDNRRQGVQAQPHIDELARPQRVVGIREFGFELERAGAGVDRPAPARVVDGLDTPFLLPFSSSVFLGFEYKIVNRIIFCQLHLRDVNLHRQKLIDREK